jgi:crotonobetainyl-CoA:carnitine CoA-transferase CaiB-like acyl-CoA transferase
VSAPPALRVVEIGTGLAGSVCGRLFAALGHDVVRCEPTAGDPLRGHAPVSPAGEGLAFVALNADKRSVAVDLCADNRAVIAGLLDGADVAIVDLATRDARAVGLSAEQLRDERPDLVAVSISCAGSRAAYDDLPGDSLLAEAYGGIAAMIGEPQRRPLSLGGEQTAYCSGVTGFLGAMLALRRRDAGFAGDVVDVAMADVAAYMDWKSDVSLFMTGSSPTRSGLRAADWRLVRASDGWVGFIFQQKHWAQVVELVGGPELADPRLQIESVRLELAEEWWPVLERWARQRSAEEIYASAQRLGLPFGWVVRASDIARSEQLRTRGFLAPTTAVDGSAPVVASPVKAAQLGWRSGRAPGLGAPASAPSRPSAELRSARPQVSDPNPAEGGPLAGVVVLDFGTITAGAAATRLLADYGATVLKIEWPDYPDAFRSWKMPSSEGDAVQSARTAPTSPYFPSNNVGKLGVAIDLKTEDGQQLVRRLARHAHVVVENYRVGVTRRLGIDLESLHAINPELVYLSLSSQGQSGPEAKNSSYGSTLDLLSGLASVTGYDADSPLWSSTDVNYPDQLVSLFGAAMVVYCLERGLRGAYLDMSQREVVSWTLAAEIADYRLNGHDSAPNGNRRPGRTPHDTFPCRDPGTWVAISCQSDDQRQSLASCLASEALAGRAPGWWLAHEDAVDAAVTEWTSARSRDQVLRELRAAGIPAVPVLDAAGRREDPHFVEREVIRREGGIPVKGLPMLFRGFEAVRSEHAPGLGEHTSAVLQDLCGLSDEETRDLEAREVIYCGTRQEAASSRS